MSTNSQHKKPVGLMKKELYTQLLQGTKLEIKAACFSEKMVSGLKNCHFVGYGWLVSRLGSFFLPGINSKPIRDSKIPALCWILGWEVYFCNVYFLVPLSQLFSAFFIQNSVFWRLLKKRKTIHTLICHRVKKFILFFKSFTIHKKILQKYFIFLSKGLW